MKWFNLENLRNSSFHITPNLPIITTKRYKYSIIRLVAYLGVYTILAWLVLIFILSITPLKDFLFVIDNSELKSQREKIQVLQNRVETLTSQLQNIASTNERMKYAMMLAQKDSVKSNDALYDSLRKPINKKIKIGGDLFSAFNGLIDKFSQSTEKSKPLIFLEPANGVITEEFLPDKGHMGIDFGVKSGSPIYASAGGLVTFSDYTISSGYTIIIQHDQNYITIYQHCSSLLKKARDVVSQGELIALSGDSGKNTTGPHLHFEIWQNGKPVDPQKILLK
ncbi:MAG: peptidoglycan DD-metalloendopeptidase family protein [Melioribacteraceae bacterium]